MPTYRQIKLQPRAPAIPVPAAVPMTPTSPDVAHDVLGSLDTLIPSGHRVLFEWGLRGGVKFLIPNGTDPESTDPRVYPNGDTARIVGRGATKLTSGHFVRVEVLALPSGPCQRTVYLDSEGSQTLDPGEGVSYDEWISDGASGRVEVECTYTNSDAQTITVTAVIPVQASGENFYAEPPNAFASIVAKTATAVPQTGTPSAEHWQKWTRGKDVEVAWVIKEIGSVRVIDGHLTESPKWIVVDQADPVWPSTIYAGGGGFPYGSLPSDYPIQQLTDTDPGGGVESLARAVRDQGRALGPALISWSSSSTVATLEEWISYDYETTDVDGSGDDEAPAHVHTGTTPTLAPFTITAESDNNPGWAVGCYAVPADHGIDFLGGLAGVIPVLVTARCRVSAGTGTYRLTTGLWSEVVWTVTSTTWVDVEVAGWLEVGTSPQASPRARLWLSSSEVATVEYRDLAVHHRPR